MNRRTFVKTLPALTDRLRTRVTLVFFTCGLGTSSMKYWFMPLVTRMSLSDLAMP